MGPLKVIESNPCTEQGHLQLDEFVYKSQPEKTKLLKP